MKKILTIIVSYNFMQWIDRCMLSLRNSVYTTDVLVIDNCSTDDTVRTLQMKYPEARLIINKQNLGFGKANNIGIELALKENYDAVFLLNQDAWIDPSTIGKLTEMSDKYPHYGILSPIHLTGDRSKPEHGFAIYTGLNDLNKVSKEDIVKVPFINAAVWYIPIKTIKEVGMFAPLFYHYGEDKDFANRITYFGYHMGYIPKAFACHDREYRKVRRKDFIRAEQVYHLSEYANINYSFGRAFAFSILAGFKKAIISVFRGKLKDFVVYLKISFGLIRHTSKVLATRRESYRNKN